jgi:hypothetical protein
VKILNRLAGKTELGEEAGSPEDIQLGFRVRDAITGFTGHVIQRIDFMNGNVQFAVQPKGEPNAMPDALWIDWHTLDILDEGINDRVTDPTEDVEIRLGQKVEDKITGYTGIATMRCLYMNGCTSFSVAPRVNFHSTEQLKLPDVVWFDHKRLKVLDAPAVVTPPAPADQKGRRPGGPPNRFNNKAVT